MRWTAYRSHVLYCWPAVRLVVALACIARARLVGGAFWTPLSATVRTGTPEGRCAPSGFAETLAVRRDFRMLWLPSRSVASSAEGRFCAVVHPPFCDRTCGSRKQSGDV
uniref:Putative secreted protein n=1 Tax=Anopheles marajoara TaxID=58244 RepID=A0A2M4C839_9DIPT